MPPLNLIALRDMLPTAAHYGVSSDSSTAIGLIALSRLMRTKDDATVGRAVTSPLGMAVLDALRGVLLRAASGGAHPALSEANVANMLNLPGSSTKYQSQYGSFGSLQSRLPWQRFRQLISALLEALTAARKDQVGYQVGYRLIASTPTSPLDEGARVAMAALVEMIEPDLRARLAAGVGASAASSSSSDSSQRATPPPQLPQLPLPPSNVGIRADVSLAANLVGLIGSRIRRPLTPSEAVAVTQALDEGLSVLQTGGTEARRQLLETNLLAALATQGGAWLWASALEAIERPAASIATLVANLVEGCSLTASMLFADAAMAFATEAAAGRSGPCTVPRRTSLGGSTKGSRW